MLSALLLAAALAAGPREIVVGTLADPDALEPHRATDVLAAEIVANVCDTLVRIRPGSLQAEGALAITWATLDQRIWTFTLREGVAFHDGAPLDADAVVRNFEHLRRERAFPGRAERIGPLVVQVTLDRANASLLPTLSQPFYSLQSPRRLDDPYSPPVGTGPFRLERARAGEVVLAANALYWGGAPRIDRVVYRRFPGSDALARALADGAADVTAAVDPRHVSALRAVRGLTLDSRTGLNLVYLAVNDERAPLDDPRVRQALSRAVDRSALVRVMAGHAEPAVGVLPPGLVGHDSQARDLLLDREAARRILTAARPGRELVLAVSRAPRPYLAEPLRVAARLQEDLAEAGLPVRTREVETWAEQVTLTTAGDFDLALLGWQADTLDPNDFLTALLDSSSIGTTNRSRYRSAEMDALLKRARLDPTPRARLALYRHGQDLFQRDMPFVPLVHSSVFTAHRREVLGLAVGPTGILRYDKAWKQP
ncbi:MAG: ABC transporter substrate-binding protein [Vicinamibacteria bacterium]